MCQMIAAERQRVALGFRASHLLERSTKDFAAMIEGAAEDLHRHCVIVEQMTENWADSSHAEAAAVGTRSADIDSTLFEHE
jgi:hypothetical protein